MRRRNVLCREDQILASEQRAMRSELTLSVSSEREEFLEYEMSEENLVSSTETARIGFRYTPT